MFIQTEQTPNSVTLKILSGQTVLELGAADFTSPADAAVVFFWHDFISITKNVDHDWYVMNPSLLSVITK